MNRFNINDTVMGKWQIIEEIGSGSFGTVYKIKREDAVMTTYSALKVIRVPQNKSEIKTLRGELGDDRSVLHSYPPFL